MMIVKDQTISYMGQHDEQQLAGADQVVNLGGKWIMPGLMLIYIGIPFTRYRGRYAAEAMA